MAHDWTTSPLVAMLSVWLGACATSPPPPPPRSLDDTAKAQPPVHTFSNNWGDGPGCTPRGPTVTLRATLVVRPLGKGTQGALLKTSTDTWVVSYRAEDPLLDLDGKQVIAQGRPCDKQGQALMVDHFDLQTLRRAPAPGPD